MKFEQSFNVTWIDGGSGPSYFEGVGITGLKEAFDAIFSKTVDRVIYGTKFTITVKIEEKEGG